MTFGCLLEGYRISAKDIDVVLLDCGYLHGDVQEPTLVSALRY
jgi:hypothetical protein